MLRERRWRTGARYRLHSTKQYASCILTSHHITSPNFTSLHMISCVQFKQIFTAIRSVFSTGSRQPGGHVWFAHLLEEKFRSQCESGALPKSDEYQGQRARSQKINAEHTRNTVKTFFESDTCSTRSVDAHNMITSLSVPKNIKLFLKMLISSSSSTQASRSSGPPPVSVTTAASTQSPQGANTSTSAHPSPSAPSRQRKGLDIDVTHSINIEKLKI